MAPQHATSTPGAAPSDKIWYDDISVLAKRWKEFFPTPEQTSEERVNALVRLVAYATLAAFAYNREVRTLVMGAAVVAVVSFAFGQRRGNEAFPMAPLRASNDTRCTPPSRENPFSNVLLTDLGKPERPPACAYDAVKDSVKENFNAGLFRNATDIYEKENSQHQYYTMPVTTTIPDTGAFANFLYGGMRSCKQDAAACPSRI